MKAILNVIWLLFGGIWLALGYVLAGIVCCLLIVTIPFGIASFRIASYALWPFGRTVIDSGRGTGVLATLGNVIWLVFAGVWIAIGHVLTAIPMFVSIIGIPLGIANLKMIPISLVPLGKRIVPTAGPGLVPYNSPTAYATYSGTPGKGRYGR
ncbi:YccF domain-containing protein [Arthrobacter sp. Sa2CUA1]|uniref:YccF domain-containing protein n=2 Tax=Arthrobacter TaxID=1663 RepID=A0ABR8UT78_9MICC|nr:MULTISPECIES: YccF domain-containing protein [Arthrobacter]MBD7995744.1 YccF domain-containing protein [Arthrobacter gallicola]MBD8044580.1 YccF domain-containing protein [Arthrobacter pullicola]